MGRRNRSRGLRGVGLFFATLAIALANRAYADEFYADPANGSMSGDGSMQKPWATLEVVVQAGLIGKTIKAGDTLFLRSGFHGALALKGGTYAPSITLAAASGETPSLSHASFAGVVSACELLVRDDHANELRKLGVAQEIRVKRRLVLHQHSLR